MHTCRGDASTVMMRCQPGQGERPKSPSDRAEAAERLPAPGWVAGMFVAVGLGAVWVSIGAHDMVVRLDPGSGDWSVVVAGGSSPTALAVGDGAVWVTALRR